MPPGMAAQVPGFQGRDPAPPCLSAGEPQTDRGDGRQPTRKGTAPAHGRRPCETRGRGHPQGGQQRTASRQAEGPHGRK
eukprot:1136042-Heterocapsa_arctica.AAC.1